MVSVADQVVYYPRVGKRHIARVVDVDVEKKVCKIVFDSQPQVDWVSFDNVRKIDVIPLVREQQDWSAVQALCETYLADLIQTGYADEDTREYVFEAAMQVVYGDKVWDFARLVQG